MRAPRIILMATKVTLSMPHCETESSAYLDLPNRFEVRAEDVIS